MNFTVNFSEQKDYDKKFKQYLDENSADKPGSFFGAWAWYETKKKEFESIYFAEKNEVEQRKL